MVEPHCLGLWDSKRRRTRFKGFHWPGRIKEQEKAGNPAKKEKRMRNLTLEAPVSGEENGNEQRLGMKAMNGPGIVVVPSAQ